MPLIDICAELTPYGVQVRYPAQIEIEEADMHHALAGAEQVRRIVEQKIAAIP